MRLLFFIILGFFSQVSLSGCTGIAAKAPTKVADIPLSCKDPRHKFKSIKSILSKSSYNTNATNYQPIIDPKGFISVDFNKDGKTDFHFIERLASEIRLISCMSNSKRYKRRITPFKVHETIKSDFQTISETIRVQGEALILSINMHEHNWGSDSEISTYAYSKNNKEFLLEQREITSQSGDGMRGDTFEFYDLKNQKYKKISSCGSLEEGCKAFSKSGRLKLPKTRATLMKPVKIYSQLL
ncbi:MAG: hypothetical protein V3U71_05670 [Cocleimonas sp.]